MTSKPIGGRGHKAPYTTSTIRVPDPIIDKVNSMVNQYRENVLNGQNNDNLDYLDNNTVSHYDDFSKENLIQLSQDILKQKKSARLSLEKLLQVLYDDKTIKL